MNSSASDFCQRYISINLGTFWHNPEFIWRIFWVKLIYIFPLKQSWIKLFCYLLFKILITLIVERYSGVRLRSYTSNKSLCKWGQFEKAKTTFKILLATWFLMCFFKRFRSFVAENLESLDQSAAKLLAIKLWEWFNLESGPTCSSGAGAGRQTFSWDLQIWKLGTLQPFNLQITSFQHWKI